METIGLHIDIEYKSVRYYPAEYFYRDGGLPAIIMKLPRGKSHSDAAAAADKTPGESLQDPRKNGQIAVI